MEIIVNSTGFKQGSMMPARFSLNGGNLSPEISWQTRVEGIKSFCLICDDPDAPSGDWVHWILYNIPPEVRSLPEGVKNLPDGTLEGMTDYRRLGYGGPCPPSGIHRYYFRLYGLEARLSIGAGALKKTLLKEMEGLVLAKGELMGRFEAR